MTDTHASTIDLRLATPADDRVLHDLSRLDSARPIERPVLLAVVDGAPVAAISLDDGRVVADPFRPTADVVSLMRASVAALNGKRPRQRRHRVFAGRLRHAV